MCKMGFAFVLTNSVFSWFDVRYIHLCIILCNKTDEGIIFDLAQVYSDDVFSDIKKKKKILLLK